jgi:hypothetical protein
MPQKMPEIKDNDMIERGITGNLEGQRCSIMVKAKKRWFRPDSNWTIRIDFQGAKITSDIGFLKIITFVSQLYGLA